MNPEFQYSFDHAHEKGHDHQHHSDEDHDHDHGHDHDDHSPRPKRGVVDPKDIGEPGFIHVLICKGFSGEIIRAEIATHDIIEQAIPVIADQIGYYSPDFEKIGIYNLTQDFEYGQYDRFCDRGTHEGDLLMMADGGACHK
jgi:hypothetical protein